MLSSLRAIQSATDIFSFAVAPQLEENRHMSMSPWAERLAEKYFGDSVHPYAIFEDVVRKHLRPEDALLDAGCGHGAPVLRKFLGAAHELVGLDVVNFDSAIPGLRLV